ncbi:DUF6221 family protein [Streptomyces sp. GLT-R25]
MDELVQWLREQLDEDERVAREASGWLKPAAHWSLDEWSGREQPHSLIAQGSPKLPVVGGRFTADPIPTVQAEHIARHDPARVLREIDAKRRVVQAYEDAVTAFNDSGPAFTSHDRLTGSVSSLRGAVELLALPYADRPGYLEDWRS